MKVSLKGNEWVIRFDTVTLRCNINKVNEVYSIVFKISDKIINIKTPDLEKTILSLEKSFNSKSISNYR